jgi:Rrf2 family nitric oxide-sensitive transcriptional repressor
MRLTSFTDFGLRALMRLAAEPERVFTTDEIASEFRISRHHLFKVVRALAEGGIIVTYKGTGGGFKLARSPNDITLGEVVRLMESGQALVECFRSDGGACVMTPRCRLRHRLAEAHEAFLGKLDKTSLSECAYSAIDDNTHAPLSTGGG